MSYAHAGGIDRPLVITKNGVSVVPHQNWRGQFSSGTRPDGSRSDCGSGQTTGCIPVAWPGWRTTVWHRGAKELDIRNWYGGLVDGMRDASGQMYMRNRYYDPATGQFTQQDPIGLAGGLNAYGFASGDPVSYSDPYGLASCDKVNRSDCSKWELIALGVADRLAPVAPTLNALGEIIVMWSPDPLGEITVIMSGTSTVFRHGDDLLDGARGARDRLSSSLSNLRGKNRPATVTAGYNVETGEIAARACSGGRCAEDHVVDALGGDASKVRFTEAVRPRTGEQVPVCTRCEANYGREAFPKGTRFQSDPQ